MFGVDPTTLTAATDHETAAARAERVLGGEYQAFRGIWKPLPGSSADWLRHPDSGVAHDPDAPWWRTEHLSRTAGDIKELWEPARFAWTYDLLRMFIVTGEDRYARAVLERIRTWEAAASPFNGPHWSCGQETAIRAAALLYVEANLVHAPSCGTEERRMLRDILSASGERIADALGYAISQRNNHAISEAAGLVMLGVRFSNAHPEADAWLADGLRILERSLSEQIAPDGWYVQHSFNYLRLVLDQCVLAERALRTIGRSLSPSAAERISAGVALLLEVIDPASGRVPNHGANDGSFIHPVTLAAYRDFRPTLTAACSLWGIPLPAPVQSDAETLAWIGAAEPPRGPALPDGVRVGSSGWASARVGATMVFLRAGRYASRPAHLDPLHLDVRIGGREIVVDPGTYSYNAPPPWNHALAEAAVHNGPVIDDVEPGVRGPRFLWYIWPRADIVSAEWDGTEAVLVAEVPRSHRRTLRVAPEGVRCEDTLIRSTGHLRVRWLLAPDVDASTLRTAAPGVVLEASPERPQGWFSPTYGVRLESRYVEICEKAPAGASILTEIGFPEGR